MKRGVIVFLLLFFVACSDAVEEIPVETPPVEAGSEAGSVSEAGIPLPPSPAPSVPVPSPTPAPCIIEETLSRMTVEEKIGQLFILRLPRNTLYVNDAVETLFSIIPFGGVIIFGENVESAEQVRRLTSELQELSPLPMFVAVDEEGGRVSRVGHLFSGGATARAFDIAAEDAYETGLYIGRELAALGINMNFAPVADIWSNPQNEVIGHRAFGRTAEDAAPSVAAVVSGLQDGGIIAVTKHFPGHGDTYEDSHFQLAIYRHSFEHWLANEALPFQSGIHAGGIMFGHIATPEISETDELPATFSEFWHSVVREEMGFDGLIITDALEMRALTSNYTCSQIAVAAFLAGADILLIPRNSQEAFEALLHAFETGLFDEERLDESVRRILRAKLNILT